jgi:hypothetical protein
MRLDRRHGPRRRRSFRGESRRNSRCMLNGIAQKGVVVWILVSMSQVTAMQSDVDGHRAFVREVATSGDCVLLWTVRGDPVSMARIHAPQLGCHGSVRCTPRLNFAVADTRRRSPWHHRPGRPAPHSRQRDRERKARMQAGWRRARPRRWTAVMWDQIVDLG